MNAPVMHCGCGLHRECYQHDLFGSGAKPRVTSDRDANLTAGLEHALKVEQAKEREDVVLCDLLLFGLNEWTASTVTLFLMIDRQR